VPTLKSAGLADYALLTLLAAVFGSSFLFTNLAVESIPPFTVVASRIALAAVVIVAWLIFRGEGLPRGGVWGWIVASALFGNAIPFSLISWGQQEVDAGLTAIFMAVMPLTTVVLAHFVTDDEKLNRWTFTGVWFGLAGVVVLMGWQALSAVGDNVWYQLAILLGAMCYAVNALITRKLTHLSKWSMSAGLLLAATGLTVPLALLFESPWQQSPSASSIYAVFALAAGPTALATWLILVIIGRQGASFLSQINFMVPMFGVFFGAVFLHERLPANAWAALSIILVGVALARKGGRARP
jgi:drug/metabolite transporter (DMT)-like permease